MSKALSVENNEFLDRCLFIKDTNYYSSDFYVCSK